MMLQQSGTTDSSSRNILPKKPRRPHTKTRTGCRICRLRKVKCDETHPTCKNCQRRGLEAECEYLYSGATHNVVPIATGSWMQSQLQDHGQQGGLADTDQRMCTGDGEGIANLPEPAIHATGPVPAHTPGHIAVGGISLPPVTAFDRPPLSPGSTIPLQTRDRSCASAYTPQSSTGQCASTSMHHPIQPPMGTSSRPLLPCAPTLTPHLDPGELTTATLIHLFTTTTAFSCSTQRATQRVYSIHLPRQALRLAHTHSAETEYLLCSLLAVAALHAAVFASHDTLKSSQDRLTGKRMWMTIAHGYHGLTLKGFRIAVEKYAESLRQGTRGVRRGEEMLAKMARENPNRGYDSMILDSRHVGRGGGTTTNVASFTRVGEGREGDQRGAEGQGGEVDPHDPTIVGRSMDMAQSKAAIFSQLGKELVDELEAILLAGSLLTIYDIASGKLDSEYSSSASRPSHSTPAAHSHGTPTTTPPTCKTDITSMARLSALTPSRPMLSWIPLIRGAPTMVRLSPVGLLILSQGHLAPLTAGLYKNLDPDHPYQPKLIRLRDTLFTQDYIPHPNLPQPFHPMTRDTFTKVIGRLTECFERFFGGGDFLAVVMRFSSSVEKDFCMALGVGVAAGEEGEHVTGYGGGEQAASSAIARGCEGRRDPRALVIMAYGLVLFVLVVQLFPEDSSEAYVGEAVYGVLGVGFLDSGVAEESHLGSSEGEFEPDASGNEYCTAETLNGGGHPRPSHPTNASSPVWWVAGLGDREIGEIARYLGALDEQERCPTANGTEVRMPGGRWMKWMEWPLEMIKNRGRDVVGRLKEAAQKGK